MVGRDCGRDAAKDSAYAARMLKIKEIRTARGWTQDQLAEVAGMSRSHIAMIVSGARRVNTDRLDAIARALDVPTELLFDGTGAEARMIQVMRALSAEDRSALIRMAEALAPRPSPPE
jgi:transcriptional regulator with XRE-family HTH domain